MIPENITKKDILKALEEIDKTEIPKIHGARKRYLEYGNKEYPTKYVISIANKFANGKEFPTADFNATESENFLKKLGFNIVDITKDNTEENKMIETETQQEKIDSRYGNYVTQGKIVFVTFHPSLSYEEFIEGITFNVKDGDGYIIKEGIFKSACSKALYLALKANSIEIQEPEDYAKKGTWAGLYEQYNQIQINREEFWKNADSKDNRVVMIIDEINRGDVAKIFGELITLIEEDKRLGKRTELTSELPITRDKFGVPQNLYLIGTMNTADRSLVQLDVALRRRFSFDPMWPKLNLEDNPDEKLKSVLEKNNKVVEMIKKLNERILKEPDIGPDKLIGHSYLFDLDKMEVELWLEKKIIPLVYEYANGIKENFLKILFDDKIPQDDDLDKKWYKFDIIATKMVEINGL